MNCIWDVEFENDCENWVRGFFVDFLLNFYFFFDIEIFLDFFSHLSKHILSVAPENCATIRGINGTAVSDRRFLFFGTVSEAGNDYFSTFRRFWYGFFGLKIGAQKCVINTYRKCHHRVAAASK